VKQQDQAASIPSATPSTTGRRRSQPRLTRKLKITVESVNFQLRKIIKNRGHFPGDDAAIKLLYLGIRNITGRHIDGDGLVRERGERGTGTYGWKAAMNAFAVAFGDRVPV
jgi:putative transposase